MGLDCTSGPQELVASHVIPSGRPQTQHRWSWSQQGRRSQAKAVSVP